MMRPLLTFAIFVGASLLPHSALACSCMPPPSICGAYTSEDAVFVGTVIAREAGERSGELAEQLQELTSAAQLRRTLPEAGVDPDAIPELAELAAQQWTGTFNPRPFDAAGAAEIYRAAL